MEWKKLLKPSFKKIIITLICVLIIPTLLGTIWDIFDLPGKFTVLLSSGIIITYAKALCSCTGCSNGMNWNCYILRSAYWWTINLIVYYLLVSIFYFRFKK